MKKRIISAIFLLLILIPLIIEGNKTFALAVGIIGMLGLKEIIDLKKSHGRIPLYMSIVFCIIFLFITYISPFEYSGGFGINYKMLSLMLLVFLIPTLFPRKSEGYSTSDAIYFLGMTLFLGVACHSLIMIRTYGIWMFLYIVLIPVLTDTFAFLFGKMIGKHKLSPHISPNKTIEGSVLGSLCATVISTVFYIITVGNMNLIPLICVTLLFSIIAQMGDLLFSKIKRENEIKDFSDLIPEHGGILDRFDSIIFVSVAFLLLIEFL